MSGHSKWAGIKHKKAIVDAKRGQMFTKLTRELTVAAREGGSGDPASNFRLRLAVQKAREANMPADNIERAIARGVGGKDDTHLDEVRYEGYGPHGVAVIIDALTDNRNRTLPAIRNIFSRAGGSLGETNSVAWMFRQQGVIDVDVGARDPDEMALHLLDRIIVGEDGDVIVDGQTLHITVAPVNFEQARAAAEDEGLAVFSAEVTMNPSTTVELDEKQAPAVIKLLEALEEHDDVQAVYANADIPDVALETEE